MFIIFIFENGGSWAISRLSNLLQTGQRTLNPANFLIFCKEIHLIRFLSVFIYSYIDCWIWNPFYRNFIKSKQCRAPKETLVVTLRKSLQKLRPKTLRKNLQRHRIKLWVTIYLHNENVALKLICTTFLTAIQLKTEFKCTYI